MQVSRYLSILFLCLCVSLAATASTLDQSSPAGGGSGIGFGGANGYLAQTYTAGLTGTLGGVSIATFGFGGSYTLSIYDVSGGLPGTTLLGSTTVGGSNSINDIITFPTAIAQIAGTQYAIVLQMGANANYWQLSGFGGDTYLGGHLFASYDGTNWFDLKSVTSADDLYFRTYVPEPATSLLLGAGLVALTAFRRRKTA